MLDRTPEELARSYVRLHNTGVRTGDFTPMLELFDPNIVFTFEGIRYGPILGINQTKKAFSEHPPTDTMKILEITEDGSEISIKYYWAGNPHATGGTLKVLTERGAIVKLSVIAHNE